MAVRRRTFLLLLLALAGLPCFAAADDRLRANAAKVEAAFLRNFAHYVNWPADTFTNPLAPWRICVLGSDPFGNVLEETFKGRLEQGRSFAVVRATSSAEVHACHLVYIAIRSSDGRRAAIADLADRPILTVGDAPTFLQEGGMIRFQVSEFVGFGVNLDRTTAADLKVPTKMLEVASEVVEGGTTRKRR